MDSSRGMLSGTMDKFKMVCPLAVFVDSTGLVSYSFFLFPTPHLCHNHICLPSWFEMFYTSAITIMPGCLFFIKICGLVYLFTYICYI